MFRPARRRPPRRPAPMSAATSRWTSWRPPTTRPRSSSFSATRSATPAAAPGPSREPGPRSAPIAAATARSCNRRNLRHADHVPLLHGSGKVIRHRCGDCRGSGYVLRRMTRKVEIPAGVDMGRKRSLRRGGAEPGGGPPGDRYCVIHVKEHELFHRDGRRLICQAPISYAQAALGAVVQVPTLDGCEEVTIPAGTQPGDVLTLRGRGCPIPAITVAATCWCNWPSRCPEADAAHEEVLRSWRKSKRATSAPSERVFVDKLKEYFHPEP